MRTSTVSESMYVSVCPVGVPITPSGHPTTALCLSYDRGLVHALGVI